MPVSAVGYQNRSGNIEDEPVIVPAYQNINNNAEVRHVYNVDSYRDGDFCLESYAYDLGIPAEHVIILSDCEEYNHERVTALVEAYLLRINEQPSNYLVDTYIHITLQDGRQVWLQNNSDPYSSIESDIDSGDFWVHEGTSPDDPITEEEWQWVSDRLYAMSSPPCSSCQYIEAGRYRVQTGGWGMTGCASGFYRILLQCRHCGRTGTLNSSIIWIQPHTRGPLTTITHLAHGNAHPGWCRFVTSCEGESC